MAHFPTFHGRSPEAFVETSGSDLNMGNCSRSKNYDSSTVELKNEDNSGLFDTILHEGPILGVTYSSSRNKVLTCSDDQRIAVSDISSLRSSSKYVPTYLIGHKKAVNKVLCRGDLVWSTSRDLTVKLWDINTGTCTLDIPKAHELNIVGLAINHFDQSVIYSGSRDYSVKAWDVESGACKATYSTPRNIVTTLQASPTDANLLYQGSEDLFVRVWDVRTPSSHAPAQVISGYVYFPVSMDVRSDGQVLATGTKGFDSVGCTVKVWDLRNVSAPLADFAGHSQDVVGCKFSSDDPELILSASKDGSIRAWSTQAAGAGAEPRSVACYPHTGKLVSCLAVPPAHEAGSAGSAGASGSGSGSGDHLMAVGANDGSLTFASVVVRKDLKTTITVDGSTKPYFQQEADDD